MVKILGFSCWEHVFDPGPGTGILHATLPGWKKISRGDPVLCESVCALEKETPREDCPRGSTEVCVSWINELGVKVNVLTS